MGHRHLAHKWSDDNYNISRRVRRCCFAPGSPGMYAHGMMQTIIIEYYVRCPVMVMPGLRSTRYDANNHHRILCTLHGFPCGKNKQINIDLWQPIAWPELAAGICIVLH